MVEMKEAVKAAHAFAVDLYEDEELRGLRVEELELTESDPLEWRVTLGWVEMARASISSSLLVAARGHQALPRVYKVFHVDADSGMVKRMTMYDE